MSEHIYDLIIVGAGPAGLTAGLYAGRATLDTLILEGNSVGGQVTTTSVVYNYPGVVEVDGTELMKCKSRLRTSVLKSSTLKLPSMTI